VKIVGEFPREVREIETCWIPLADGTRLAARIWLPVDAEARPVPAILEYLPYRRRDGTILRDAQTHPYFAGHGYASVRVDIRGTGDSEGFIKDEYLPQEQLDAVEVIDWLARQSWCSGRVGMMGISWGGFNSLQVAARRPPALKAIITVCSTDDRYRDDCHYMGGCLLNNNFTWASTLFAYAAQPPYPEVVGERWRDMWLARLDQHEPPLIEWLSHQTRDAYWKQGSVAEDFGAIDAAVYAVGGWADGYSNAIPRLLAGLRCPRKGLIGPWAHDYPHFAAPGPTIGFLQEALRWWDQWLAEKKTGIMAEPMLRIWMQDSVPPASTYAERPGRWIAEAGWPPASVSPRRYHLAEHRLSIDPQPNRALILASPLTTGTANGEWCPYGNDGELPADQRVDDGRSLVFDGESLTDQLEILGAPRVALRIAADRPVAQVGVRLCDVAPDGASTLVTYGVLNLTHRAGDADPEPLAPGEHVQASIALNDIAHRFPPGHRIRLAVSSALWPMVWPVPHRAELKLATGDSHLELPVRRSGPLDAALRPFAGAEASPAARAEVVRDAGRTRTIIEDPTTGITTVAVARADRDFRLLDIGVRVRKKTDECFVTHATDPTQARAETEGIWETSCGDWRVRTETRTVMTADPESFRVDVALDAFEGDTRVFSRRWKRAIPRRLV
jgi:uncharacterized protein